MEYRIVSVALILAAFLSPACSNDASFKGKNSGFKSVQKPVPTATPKSTDQKPPPQQTDFGCEIRIDKTKLYVNFNKFARVTMVTGIGTTKALLNGAEVSATGTVHDVSLSSLLPDGVAAKEVEIKGEVFDASGKSASCSKKTIVSLADVSLQFEILREALGQYSGTSCASSTIGVLAFSAKVKNLFSEEKVSNYIVDPVNSDLKRVECKTLAAVKQTETVGGMELFEHNIRCLYVNRASPAHLEYADNLVKVVVEGANLPDGKGDSQTLTTFCQYPSKDPDAPCEARDGRTVIAGIKPTETAIGKGAQMCPAAFPADAQIATDVAPFR